jgi:hypothetical protein
MIEICLQPFRVLNATNPAALKEDILLRQVFLMAEPNRTSQELALGGMIY